MKAIFNIFYEEIAVTESGVNDSTSNYLGIPKYLSAGAQSIVELPGKAVYNIANTNTGKIALGTLAALTAARHLAKKYQEKNTRETSSEPLVSSPSKKTSRKELDWEKGGPKLKINEQNENLPGFPSYSNFTKHSPMKSPRSIASVLMKRKPNNYDTSAERDHLETSRKILSKNVDDNQATTGVDKVIGKLVA